VGMEEKQGIAGSLFVVAVTSLVALVSHARAGRVHWSTGILFGLVGMIGASTGGRAAAWIPGQYLLLGFGAVALATAMAMIRGRKEAPQRDAPLPVAKVVALGLLVGSVSARVRDGGAAAGRTAPRGEGGGPRPSRRLHLRAGGGGRGLSDRTGADAFGRASHGRRHRHLASGHRPAVSGGPGRTRHARADGLAAT